ncbi:MAG: hypothetical protein FWD61_12645 [Phycisphaerales bacterium]|nr:hypothetical protein [Phycisphaerales bacterium]
MKRAILGAMALAVAMTIATCDRQDETPKVDPKLDGLSGQKAAVDPTIFENHAEIYRKLQPAPAPATAPTTTTAPAEAAPAEGSPPSDTPPPALGDAPPPPPPG